MKYMKLGSKPDAFQADGGNVKYVVAELATDIVISVGRVKFYLHKFPLLSKSQRLQRLIFKATEDNKDVVNLHDFPGGPKAFEMCAKFCYGMIVTLNAYNVVAARCAAEYLEMTEDVEKGNMIYKIEVFLNSSVLRSWKDSIIVLQTTQSLLPWSEELKVVGRCIDSIASKTSVDPSNVTWSYTYKKKSTISDDIVTKQQRIHHVPKDWWIEDICELDVHLYKRIMVAVKSKGRMSSDIIGEALKAYAIRWLPDSIDALVSDHCMSRNRVLVETIIRLLPPDDCSCNFLLKLLKVAVLVSVGDVLKEELMKRISIQLHKASVKDLLIPTRSLGETIYDIDLVQSLVKRYLLQDWSSYATDHVEKVDSRTNELILGHASLVALGKLIDGYLAKIAADPNLPISTFIDLLILVPEAARPIHDGLYTAIDVYLKEHPSLKKIEKKRLCSLMDIRKLSTDACMHAAQNEGLPLRVVVQVLFFEQLRTAAAGFNAPTNEILHENTRSTVNVEEDWERPVPEDYMSLEKQLRSVKIREGDCQNCEEKKVSNIKNKGGILLLPSRSRRILDKFWTGKGEGEIRSSETSGSSQSPPTSGNPGEGKSSGFSSKDRRHSIS